MKNMSSLNNYAVILPDGLGVAGGRKSAESCVVTWTGGREDQKVFFSNPKICNISSPDFVIVWSLQRGDVDAAASLHKEKGKAKAKLT